MKAKQKALQFIFGGWFVSLFIPILFQIPETKLTLFRNQDLVYICHQKLERFFSINGYFPLVCARDIGVYLGMFIFNFFIIRELKFKSLYFLLPLIADKFFEKIIRIDPGNYIRFLSGICISVTLTVLIQHYMIKK